MTKTKTSTKCMQCGEELKFNSDDPCPKCGSKFKTSEVEVHLPSLKAEAKVGEIASEENKEVINYPLLILVIVLTLGSPLLGLYLSGVFGVIIGLIIAVISLYLGFKALINRQKIENHTYN